MSIGIKIMSIGMISVMLIYVIPNFSEFFAGFGQEAIDAAQFHRKR